ncbi:hypothetical protein ACYPKM_01245 [Pseudomonas aeruginosa]
MSMLFTRRTTPDLRSPQKRFMDVFNNVGLTFGRPGGGMIEDYVHDEERQVLDELPEELLAEAFVQLVMSFRVEAAIHLWKERGPFSVSINPEQAHLFDSADPTGVAYKVFPLSKRERKIKHESVLSLCAILVKEENRDMLAGSKWVNFFSIDPIKAQCLNFEVANLGLELPTIREGRLYNPELARTLWVKDVQLGLPSSWFDDVLCWVPIEALPILSETLTLRPFGSVGRVRVRGFAPMGEDGGAWRDFTLREYQELVSAGQITDHPGGNLADIEHIELGVTHPDLESVAEDAALLEYMADQKTWHGLWPEGMVLCHARVGELAYLPGFGSTDLERHVLYGNAMANYLPLKLLQAKSATGMKRPLPDNEKTLIQQLSPHVVFYRMEKAGGMRDALVSRFPREAFLAMAKSESPDGYDLRIAKVLKDVFSVPMSGMKLRYRFQSRFYEIMNPIPDGMVFDRGTEFVADQRGGNELKSPREHIRNVLSRSQGPVVICGQATDMSDQELFALLLQHTDGTNESIERAFAHELWLDRGPERMAQQITDSSQWELAFGIFSASQLKPLLRQMPARYKNRMSQAVLSL